MTKNLKTSLDNFSLIKYCPECKNGVIYDSHTGDSICESCGLVISQKSFDISNFEKNMFTSEDIKNRARTGVTDPLLAPGSYFNTIIIKKEIINTDFKRIANLDDHSNDSKARNLLIAIWILKLISGKLNLTYQIKSHAIFIYRKAFKKNLIRGRSIEGMVCASIYFTCRSYKKPITFQEIINIGGVKKRIFRICFKALIKELNLKVVPLGPEIFISKFSSQLNLSPDIEKRILFLLQHLTQFTIGKNPKIVCAGLIYLICKKNKINITQKKIAETIGCSEVSLRYTYKQIEGYLFKRKFNVKLEYQNQIEKINLN